METRTPQRTGRVDSSVLRVGTLHVPYAPVGDEDLIPLVDKTLEKPFADFAQLPEALRQGRLSRISWKLRWRSPT